MTLDELERAAREGQAVCLACEAVQSPVAFPDEGCVECGDDAVYSAAFLLRAQAFLETLGEGSND